MVAKISVAVLSVLIASYVVHLVQKRRKRLPPGPPSYPLIGQLLSAPLSYETFGYKRISEDLKSNIICLEFLGKTIVVLHSAQSATDLLDKCSSIYSDRTPSTMVAHEKLLNSGNGVLFTGYGERFRAHRRILNAWLNKGASVAFHDRQVFQARQLLNRLLRYDNQTTSSESLTAEFYRLTASSIIGATYGYEVSSLEDPFVAQIKQAVENLSKSVLPTQFLVNVLPFLVHVPEWVPGTGWKQTANEWRALRTKVARETYQWTNDQMANGTAKPSILRSVLEEHEAMGRTVSDEERINIQEVCLGLLGAGSDTTAGTLTAFLLAMLLFPDTQRKAQEEIDRIVGSDRLPEMSDLPQLPYLANLVRELLRWQPVLPLGIPHTCSQDNIYQGYFIPKGAIVIGNMWAMTRDESFYENPEVFNPDRFLDPSVPAAPTFGWGRRKCPGLHYAESLLSITIASILATFNMSKAKDSAGQDMIPTTRVHPSTMV